MKVLRTIKFSLKILWTNSPAAVVWCFVAVLARIAWYFLGIFLPRVVIDNLIAQASVPEFLIAVGLASMGLVVASYLKSHSDMIVEQSIGTKSIFRILDLKNQKHISMDYELMSDPERKKMEEKADLANQEGNHSPAVNVPRISVDLIVNIINFFLYGLIIFAVNPIIVAFLGLSVAINAVFLHLARKFEKATREERSELSQKIWRIGDYMKDEKATKDIRTYGLSNLFASYYQKTTTVAKYKRRAVDMRDMRTELVSTFMILIRDGAAYGFLIYLIIQGQLDLGEFVFIFAAIGMFSTWVGGINRQLSELLRATSELRDMQEWLEAPDRTNLGKGQPLPDKTLAPNISLKNLTYTYPGAEKPTLKSLNLEIVPGERLAIVGNNGAGKTTLVKLLCGLIHPTEGEVQLNGADSRAYNRDEYFTMFSVVFQDIHLLAEGISENVSQATASATDLVRVEKCLKAAGLWEKVQSLPEGMNSMLVKQVNENAEEFSGGEQQKLAIARAIYKDAPIIILDEPTAALDPIAESRVYEQYSELTRGKTSVYISHRLASTLFCDRIVLIEHGEILEMGTHEELMNLGGKYSEMFGIQSQYYS